METGNRGEAMFGNLLRKWFIKDYRNVDDPVVRARHGVLSSVFGLITNSILVALKLTLAFLLFASGGYVFFPMALLIDALNNATDLLSNAFTMVGFILSKKEADKEHPFGHQRIESILALLLALIIASTGVSMLRESISAILSSSTVSYDWLTCVLLGASILIKFLQSRVNFSLAKAISSYALKEAAIDSLFDCLSTAVVLATGLLSFLGSFTFLDSYAGILLSLFLIFQGVKGAIDVSNALLGEAPDPELLESVRAILSKDPRIIRSHDIILHSYGPSRRYLSLHIELDESLSLLEAHHIADDAEKALSAAVRANVVIHMDPVKNDASTLAFSEAVASLLQTLDPNIGIHDFQYEENGDGLLAKFDVVLPFGKDIPKKDIAEALAPLEEFQGKRVTFEFAIEHPIG